MLSWGEFLGECVDSTFGKSMAEAVHDPTGSERAYSQENRVSCRFPFLCGRAGGRRKMHAGGEGPRASCTKPLWQR